MDEMKSIEGQIAVVTGGAAGIGLSCVERFVEEGAKIAIVDRDENSARQIADQIAADGGDAIAVGGECTSDTDMQAALAKITEKWDRLDILVNCAGGFHATPSIEELDEEAWRKGIDWNLSGVFFPIRAAVPIMKSRQYGRIVNIGSGAGRTGLPATAIDYSAGKAGVAGLSRRMAVELAPFGITVNTVTPGPIRTPRFAELGEDRAQELIKIIPVGRIGLQEEVAHAVWWLSTPGAAYTTGVTLDVNGGIWTG